MNNTDSPALNRAMTEELVVAVKRVITSEDHRRRARTLAKMVLGARPTGRDGAFARVRFGIWMPGIADGKLADRLEDIRLEIFRFADPFDFAELPSGTSVSKEAYVAAVRLEAVGDYLVGEVDGVVAGDRTTLGDLYWLRYDDGERRHIIRDPLAASLPFGIYAPAEVFDVTTMLAGRRDMEYFRTHNARQFSDGTYRAHDVGMHLEIHTETATSERTFAALTERYRRIGESIQEALDAGEEPYARLSPADRMFVGFDSVELTPEVPPAEREGVAERSGEFFRISDGVDTAPSDAEAGAITIALSRPDISNWGYDTPILGSAAVNPSVLRTVRPNEFLEFVETLHTMPYRPIQLCIDSVLGHCDFQGARLLQTFERVSTDHDDLQHVNSAYLRGANMYGRDIDFGRPEVQALLLELLERKLAYGFDAVRVDGAQDFVADRDPVSGMRIQNDAFLNEMANIVVDINGIRRRPDFNLEDGRPWPDDINWLYNSKYLDHTIERTLPFGDRVKQWSPIIFAHNVHGKFKWFFSKWDRFVEVFRYGAHWITGNSNHDNARYFYRMTKMTPASEYRTGDAFENYYNDELGATMREVAHNALDHGALTALTLGFLPGHPMFMLNVLFHTPWTFMRDIDRTYDVKIAAEEGSRYFTWYVDETLYRKEGFYTRLKALGFTTVRSLVAPPAEKARHPGFADRLDQLRSEVKTEALAARYLFDDPEEGGGYGDALALEHALERLRAAGETNAHWSAMACRIAGDPRASEHRVAAARALFDKSLTWLMRRIPRVGAARAAVLTRMVEKLKVLASCSDRELALLIEDADCIDDYNPARWSTDAELVREAPRAMRDDRDMIASGMLSKYARAFMLDARDAATITAFEDDVDDAGSAYRLALRAFRSRHRWLAANPSNDVRRDYFARKLLPNGAKDTGDWGDTGDIVNCNTIYYGWRTSPDNREQVFAIANMEGSPVDVCPLSLFMNFSGEWTVAIASPSMKPLPDRFDRSSVIENFRNGEALILVRSVDGAGHDPDVVSDDRDIVD